MAGREFKYNLKFFTDRTVRNKFLLIKITDYIKMKDFSNWSEVFIDPGVYQLKKTSEYSWINKINVKELLNSLPANHFFTFDYPCDMNLKYENLFLKKSWNNALIYHSYSQYIVTIQYKFKRLTSFKKSFDKYNNLKIKSSILGLGNLCRIFYLTDYVKESLIYAFSNCKHKRIHIYGLALRIIPYAYNLAKENNIELSIDSTKWTKAVNRELKLQYGINCKNLVQRQIFFDTYIKIIKSRINTKTKTVK